MATKFLYEMFLSEWEPKVVPGGGEGSGKPRARLGSIGKGGATGPAIVALAKEKGWEIGENYGWYRIKGPSGSVYFPKMKSGRVPHADIRWAGVPFANPQTKQNPSMEDIEDMVNSVLHIPED